MPNALSPRTKSSDLTNRTSARLINQIFDKSQELQKSNRKAIKRNCSNKKANPALKTKTGNKKILQIDKIHCEKINNRVGRYFPKGGHSATQTELKV